jgi:hypothetical protein
MGVAFAVAAALAIGVLGATGADPKAIGPALRVTARWSFLLFWLAYTVGPMAVLFGRAFAPLARRGREFGLAFAAAHLVHIGLLVWLYRVSPRPPLSMPVFVFFSVGIFCTYLLAVLSFGGLSQALGPRLWRVVRLVGMNYILLAFARDFVPPMLHPDPGFARLVAYGPFALLSVAAPLLYLAAAARRRPGAGHAAA